MYTSSMYDVLLCVLDGKHVVGLATRFCTGLINDRDIHGVGYARDGFALRVVYMYMLCACAC